MQEGTPVIIKRKKAHKHGHHGGAWKVAYADFVTAMMAFFMVMWILSLSDDDRQLVQAYFEDPTGFSKKLPMNDTHLMPWQPNTRRTAKADAGNTHVRDDMRARDKMQEVRKQIEKNLKSDPELATLVAQRSIEMTIDAEGLHIELIESDMDGEVFFKVGSDVVQPKARAVMAKVAPVLAKSENPIVVEGHTDSRPYGLGGYDNFDLSHDRANQVRRLLTADGVPDAKFESVKGYADRKPRVPADPTHFSNRRVTILLPFAREKARTIADLPDSRLKESIQGVFRDPFRR